MIVTKENINEIVRTNDKQSVVTLLKGMDEASRLELSETVGSLIHAYLGCKNALEYYTWSELSTNCYTHYHLVNLEHRPFSRNELELGLNNLKVALVFCADAKQLNRFRSYLPDEIELAATALISRKLKGLAGFCKGIVRDGSTSGFLLVRELERNGKVKINHDANYLSCLAGALQKTGEPAAAICRGAIANDELSAFLLEPLAHRVFSEEKYRAFWVSEIDSLVEKQFIARDELTSICMELLARTAENWVKADTGWDHRGSLFAVALNDKVVLDKQNQCATYLALCGAKNSFVTSYILNLFLNGTVSFNDTEVLLSNLLGNFSGKDKEPALLSLKLLESLYKDDKVSPEVFVEKVTSAFWHKSQEVHDRALKVLERTAACRSQEAKRQLTDSIHLLKSANKIRANKLLDSQIERNTTSVILDLPATSPQTTLEVALGLARLRDTVRAIKDNSWNSQSEIVSNILAPIDFRLHGASSLFLGLHPENQFEIDESLEELAHLTKLAIGGKISTLGLERLISGLAIRWSERAGNFSELRELFSGDEINVGQSMFSSTSFSMVGLLAQAWLDGAVDEKLMKVYYPRLVSERILGLLCRMQKNLTLPMLAAPTHGGYRIEPLVFVERVLAYQDKGRLLIDKRAARGPDDIFRFEELYAHYRNDDFAADVVEFSLGLLRLAIEPDYSSDVVVDFDNKPKGLIEKISSKFKRPSETSDKALHLARTVKGDFGRALRYVLGEGELSSILNWQLALSAFRARHPLGTVNGLSAPVQDLPDALRPAQYRFCGAELPGFPDVLAAMGWQQIRYTEFYNARQCGVSYPELTVDQPRNFIIDLRLRWSSQTEPLIKCPAIVPHFFYLDWFVPGVELFSVWPNNQEAALARLARILFGSIGTTHNCWHTDFEMIFDKSISLVNNGAWVIAAGCFSASSELRSTMQDLLIDAISTNRCAVASLVEAFFSMLQFKLTASRMSDMFKEVARVSDLHALFIWQLACALLVRLDSGSRAAATLLEVVFDVRESCKFVVADELKEWLAPLKGTSNKAKIAASLRNCQLNWQDCAAIQNACQQSIDARTARLNEVTS